ncbi:MAG: STAS domain-containing protein [Candidatus Competibacteraceae bacterium]|nr:STAS domain-containing protein [Candidatus Competibacteraceae bacterium]
MEIHEQTHGKVLVISPAGRLDSLTYRSLEDHLSALIRNGKTTLVIDFTQLEYISSSGLRVLLMAAKQVRAAQGKLALAAMSASIREVFDISGFSSIFEIYPSAQEAIQAVE